MVDCRHSFTLTTSRPKALQNYNFCCHRFRQHRCVDTVCVHCTTAFAGTTGDVSEYSTAILQV